MILTEREAKEKWCPQNPTGDGSCVASACMMWRWHVAFDETGPMNDAGIPLTAQKPMRGYCGLAGRPAS